MTDIKVDPQNPTLRKVVDNGDGSHTPYVAVQGGGGGGGGDVNLNEVGGVPFALGQTVMADSLPVAIASDNNIAKETGGNLASIKTDADAISTGVGAPADSAWVSGSGSIISVLKGIFGKLAGTLSISGSVTTSGTVTEANSGSIKTDTDTIATASGAPGDSAWVSGNGSIISILKGIFAKLAGTLTTAPVSNTGPNTQNITAADVASSSANQQNGQVAVTGSPTANSAAIFNVSTLETITLQITGTWAATLVVEFSVDGGTTWFTRGLHIDGTNYNGASFTSNVTGEMNAATVTNVRVRSILYTSGTATVRLIGSVNSSVHYLANTPQIADGTIPSQKLAISSAGAASVEHPNASVASGSIGNTPTSVKSSPGEVVGFEFYNNNSTMSYVQFFDLATGSVTVGSTTPKKSIGIPPNGGAVKTMIRPSQYATAITIAVTTTRAGGTSPSNTLDYNVEYI